MTLSFTKTFTNVRALSFDLDDTLYNNKPVIRNAFLVLYNYLVDKYPRIVEHYDFNRFLLAAKNIREHQPSTANLTNLRRIHIQQVLTDSGYDCAPDKKAFDVFWQARQKVTLYDGVHSLLETLSQQLPLVAISNGNACIKAIGIDQYFQYSISASDTGKPKPDSSMFLLACKKLEIQPVQLIHIGDDIHHDIDGAFNAGCRSIWFNGAMRSEKPHNANGVIEQLSQLLDINFN